jgi:hypothetical protein
LREFVIIAPRGTLNVVLLAMMAVGGTREVLSDGQQLLAREGYGVAASTSSNNWRSAFISSTE